MHKPTWATVLGVFMLLFGGCGGCNHAGSIMSKGFLGAYDQAFENVEFDASSPDSLYEGENKKLRHIDEIDSSSLKTFEMLADTIIIDSDNNVNIQETMMEAFKLSDYRKTWIVRFGYIGLFISFLFLLSGILLLASREYTIQVVLLTLAASISFGIFQLFINAADVGTGHTIKKWGNVGIYFSLFLDILLLIIFLVLDKSYYKKSQAVMEDYYDDDVL